MNIQSNKENTVKLPSERKLTLKPENRQYAARWLGFLAMPFVFVSMFFGSLSNFDGPKFKSSSDGTVIAKFVDSGIDQPNLIGEEMAEAESCQGNWIRVRTTDGRLVWLPANHVQIVFPPNQPRIVG